MRLATLNHIYSFARKLTKEEVDRNRRDFLQCFPRLKTPIALIQGYAEGLEENVSDDEENHHFYCEVIVDEANKMNNLVRP